MRVQHSSFSIAEIRDQIERKDLYVNKEYQRAAGLWPSYARVYFIDSILEEFPFPKLYFREILEPKTMKVRREIVDGQQRVTAILDFLNDKFRLSKMSTNFEGRRFSELDEEDQGKFVSYNVEVDIIQNAERSEILEMFRRMNAYTLALNDAEKRHSIYQGPFKWFVQSFTERYYSMFAEFGIFSQRQILRMSDSDLIADLIVAFEKGVVNTTKTTLDSIYKKYEKRFDDEDRYDQVLSEIFDFIRDNFGGLRGSMIMKPYVVHSLCCALYHNKYGLPGVEDEFRMKPIGSFVTDVEQALAGLETLAGAQEAGDEDGPFGEYVWGCQAGSNRANRRTARIKYILMALRNQLLT